MNERKENFTPGPWHPEFLYCEDDGYVLTILNEDHIKVASITSHDKKMIKGNTALIAAAPEMYEGLKRLKLHFAGVPHIQKEIEVILKKARGEA